MISSELITIRETKLEDLDFVLATERHEDNRAFIGQSPEEEHRAAIEDENMAHLILEDSSGGRVGYVMLSGLHHPHQSAFIKRIAVTVKGRGYGKEAMKQIVEWVFTHTATHRLWLDVKTFNARARHVYESIGFVHEGTMRDCVKNGEAFESLDIMSLLRPEYSKNRLSSMQITK